MEAMCGSPYWVFLNIQRGLLPVSYTHLDVYKRQVQVSLSPSYLPLIIVDLSFDLEIWCSDNALVVKDWYSCLLYTAICV